MDRTQKFNAMYKDRFTTWHYHKVKCHPKMITIRPKMRKHSFLLRADCKVVVELPEDLSIREANRFGEAIKTFAFGGE